MIHFTRDRRPKQKKKYVKKLRAQKRQWRREKSWGKHPSWMRDE